MRLHFRLICKSEDSHCTCNMDCQCTPSAACSLAATLYRKMLDGRHRCRLSFCSQDESKFKQTEPPCGSLRGAFAISCSVLTSTFYAVLEWPPSHNRITVCDRNHLHRKPAFRVSSGNPGVAAFCRVLRAPASIEMPHCKPRLQVSQQEALSANAHAPMPPQINIHQLRGDRSKI